jgi:hypothetical protein
MRPTAHTTERATEPRAEAEATRRGARLRPLLALWGLAGIVASGCEHPPPPAVVVAPAAPWFVTVESVDAAPGGLHEAPLACGGLRGDCTAIVSGERVPARGMIKVTRGVRASLSLGPGLSIELGEEASVKFPEGNTQAVEITEGVVTVRSDGHAAPVVRLIDRELSLGGAPGGAVLAMVSDAREAGQRPDAPPARASLVVLDGTASLSDPGAAVSLTAGEGAVIDRGKAVEKAPRPAQGQASAPGSERRGIGAMIATLPSSTAPVEGVSLVSHEVRVAIRDGLARTEIEEVFRNDTDGALEGKYVFPVPRGASVSRLALWVPAPNGDKLVEGEVVERRRAASDPSGGPRGQMRPRQAALSGTESGGELSLKVFPLPAHGTRRLVVAYNEALEKDGRVLRYRYPFSAGREGAPDIGRVSFAVSVSESAGLGRIFAQGYPVALLPEPGSARIHYDGVNVRASSDLVVTYERPDAPAAPGAQPVETLAYLPARGEVRQRGLGAAVGAQGEGFVALRVRADAPAASRAAQAGARPRTLALVLDASEGSPRDVLAAQQRLALGAIEALSPGEKFVLLSCNSACEAFPPDGLSAAGGASLEGARAFLAGRKAQGGADPVGGILEAARRVSSGEGSGAQIVYVGPDEPTAGELFPASIAARLRPIVEGRRLDLRVLATGPSGGDGALSVAVAQLGAHHEALADGQPLDRRLTQLAGSLRSPLLTDVKIALPPGLVEVSPATVAPLALGQEVMVLAKIKDVEAGVPVGTVRLTGRLAGEPYELARPMQVREGAAAQNPLVPRLWAERIIAGLEDGSHARGSTDTSMIALGKRFHVASRSTSFVVVENERVFADLSGKPTAPSAAGAAIDLVGLGLSVGEDGPAGTVGIIGALQGTDLGGLGMVGGGGGFGLGQLGTGSGFGSSGLGRISSSRTSPPQIKIGAVQVSGRLPPEVIRRIVRQNLGRFRYCYEQGLKRNPTLGGTVTVKFVIGRDGAVANAADAGSRLADRAVISCITRGVYGLSFPQPEAGIVVVTYPISLAPPGGRLPTPPRPRAVFARGNDRWRGEGDEAIAAARRAADADPSARAAATELIHAQLLRGRFDDALAAATAFSEKDPDHAPARRLLASAAAAAGKPSIAARALDAAAALDPSSTLGHERAARSLEEAGDEVRACAHWRALADLRRGSRDVFQSLRCRARVSDAGAARAEGARRLGRADAARLLAQLSADPVPRWSDDFPVASGEVKLSCQGEGCPYLVVLAPHGEVYSAFTPPSSRAGRGLITLAGLGTSVGQTYRFLAVGGADKARGQISAKVGFLASSAPLPTDGTPEALELTVK